MKLFNKILIIIGLFIFILFTNSCNEKEELVINCDDISIYVTEKVNLNEVITNNLNLDGYLYSFIGDNFEINENELVGVKTGTDYLYIEVEGYNTIKEVKVEVKEPTITVSGNQKIYIYEQETLNLETLGISNDASILWTSSDKKVAKVSNKGVVTAVYFGTCTITASVGGYSSSIDIEVLHLPVTGFDVEESPIFETGNTYKLNYTVYPEEADSTLVFNNNSDILEIKDNEIIAKKEGKCTISFYPIGFPEFSKELEITILKNEAPKFIKTADYIDVCDVNYNNLSDLLQGLEITDNADGNIADRLECDVELIKSYGQKDIVLSVKDRAGNVTEFTRTINVVYTYHTKFVGHAGCWNWVPNSEEAFLIAARDLKYQALECDLQVTSDGVYVLNHDSFIGDFVISKHTYAELMQVEITDSSKHVSHACTLERYFEICKEYNCEAIVEIKGSSPGLNSSNQDNVDKLIKYIIDQGMYDKTIILCSMQDVIRKIRSLKYDIRIQYLVNSADNNPTLNFCIETNSDLSTNVTYGGSNTMKWLQKYWDAGLEISVWTFSGDYFQIQEWIDKGVEYVTTDCHHMDRLNLK